MFRANVTTGEPKMSLSEKKKGLEYFFFSKSVSESQFYEYLFQKFCVIIHWLTYLAFTAEQQTSLQFRFH